MEKMTNYTLSEMDAQSKKAAKGAGLTWGLAEEAGKIIRWLSAYQLKAITAFAAYLQWKSQHNDDGAISLDNHIWQNSNGPLCPIIAGSIITDYIHTITQNNPMNFGEIQWPIFLIAQLGRAAEDEKKTFKISWNGFYAIVSDKGIYYQGDNMHQVKVDKVTCCLLEQHDKILLSYQTTALPVNNADWAILANFAHKTYAPETNLSRLLGAGAGLNDND